MVLAATVGAAILLWRAAANTAALNDDPIPWVSPNDVLSPVIVYVALGLVGGSARLDRAPEWAGLRALLTLIALVVNVVTI